MHKVPRACNAFVWLFLYNGVVNFMLLFILFGFTDTLLLKIGLYDRKDVAKKAKSKSKGIQDSTRATMVSNDDDNNHI